MDVGAQVDEAIGTRDFAFRFRSGMTRSCVSANIDSLRRPPDQEGEIVIKPEMDEIIIAGDSHTVALLGHREIEEDFCLLPVEGQSGILGLYGSWPRNAKYWNALARYAPGRVTVVVWRGNDHNACFLIEQSPVFDFVCRRSASMRLEEDAVIIPEAIVRAKFRPSVAPLHDVLSDLTEQPGCRIVVAGTPPPKGDDDELRSLLRKEAYYCEVAEQLGIALEEARLTPPIIRLKLWQVLQDLYQEQAEQDGVKFLPVPDITRDDVGFLKKEFWAPDATHANAAYGRVMLDHLAHQLRICKT